MSTLQMLPEWAVQDAVLLAWPDADSDWGPHLDRVEPVYDAMAAAIAARQALLILVRSAAQGARVRARLRTLPAVSLARLHCIETDYDDTWVRDYGPLGVAVDGQLQLRKFRFTAWGGKYAAAADDAVVDSLNDRGLWAVPLRAHDLAVEGGGLETDGEGTLLATRRCLLNPNRGGLSQAEVEAGLTAALGIRRFLWLAHGALSGDDTDAHIDTLARFTDAGSIAYVQAAPGSDHPDAAELHAMETELRALRQADGSPYRLWPLPLPQAQRDDQGGLLPATYANFLLINGAVLVPTYADPADADALASLARAFPDREVIAIDARGLILQFGSIHCATMQLPAGSLNPAALAVADSATP